LTRWHLTEVFQGFIVEILSNATLCLAKQANFRYA
jgi:hypothetical protein